MPTSNQQLDLERIDKLDIKKPNDQDELGRMVNGLYRGSQGYLTRLAYTWDENIRFYMGDQHIYYNETTRSFEVIPLTKYNNFVPRPVTNLMRPIIGTVKSILTKNKPTANVPPNSDDVEDVNAARLATKLQDAKWEIDEEAVKHIQAAHVALLTGHVWRKDFWDSQRGPIVNIDGYNGPAGDNVVQIRSGFDILPDIYHGTFFVDSYAQPLEWIKSRYNQKKPYYTGMVDKIRPNKDFNTMLSLRTKLMSSSSNNGEIGGGGDNTLMENMGIINEAYIHPTRNHSSGLCIHAVDGIPLYIGPSPDFDPRFEESWHPFTEYKWDDLFFRYHGLSLAESLVPLQRRLNAIDALIILMRMTMANGGWLLPKGCGIPEGYMTGRPGLEVWYNPVGANGARPEKIQGSNHPPALNKEREKVVEEMHQIAGDNEILQGLRPKGVNTASGLSMLLEQSFSKYSPTIQQWEKFIEKGQQKKLRILQKRYKETRPDVLRKMREMSREITDSEVVAFIGKDLRDNVNVRIEAGSSIPRSTIFEQERYKEAAGAGLLGPLDPLSNPIGNQKFLEKMGIKGFNTDINADVKKARWVVGVLKQINQGKLGPEAMPKLMAVEMNPNSIQIHFKILSDAMKHPNFTDEMQAFQNRFDELNAAMQQLLLQQAKGMQPGQTASAPTPGVAPTNTPQPGVPTFGPSSNANQVGGQPPNKA